MLLLFPHNLWVPVSILVNETDQKVLFLALFHAVQDSTTTTTTTMTTVSVVVVVGVFVVVVLLLLLLLILMLITQVLNLI